jgi:hypothetical protein
VNLERKRKTECLEANCGLTKNRCLRFYGKDCIKNGGSKIPVQSATADESFPLTVQAQTTFKAYFIRDEWAETEGR